jgi:hypothetical protein
MRLFITSVICLFISACSSHSGNEKKLADIILKDESGLLRGLDLGVTVKEVKESEPTGLTEETPEYLFYEFAIDSSTNYTISYTFENDALNEIRADIYLANDSAAKNLSASFIEYFNEKYKESVTETEGLWSWPTLYKNIPIRIELSDESAEYNNVGKLSLTVYKEPEMAI